MDYDKYEENKSKKKKKRKNKKKKEEKLLVEEQEEVNENLYSDYIDKKVDLDDTLSLSDGNDVESDIKIRSKQEIIRENKKRKSTTFYTFMGIIFALLIIFVLVLLFNPNILNK